MHSYFRKDGKRKLALTLIWALVLQVLLQPMLHITSSAAPVSLPGFSFTAQAVVTGLDTPVSEVDVGETFDYLIKYQVSDATQVGKSLVIEDTVPDKFEIVNSEMWDSQAGQTVTFSPPPDGVLKAGTSGNLRITVKVKPTGSDTSVPTTNTPIAKVTDPGGTTEVPAAADVAIKPDPDGGDDPDPPTVPDVTYDKWSTYKTQDTGLGNDVKIVGGQVKYKVGIKGTAGNTDTGSLTVPAFTDTLPPEATYVSSNPSGIYSSGTITWSNIVVPSGGRFEAEVTVTYPDNYGYASNNPQNQKNSVTFATYSLTGTGTVTSDYAEVTTEFGPPKSGTPGLFKNREFQYRFPGQEQSFTIGGIHNSGTGVNSPLSDLVLVDTLPPEMDYTSISTANFQWDQFRYLTNDNVWHAVSQPGNLIRIGDSTDGLNANKDIILDSDAYLKQFEWSYNDKLPVNGSLSDITIKGIVRSVTNGTGVNGITADPVVHGDTVLNSVLLDYKELNAVIPNQLDDKSKNAAADFQINNEKPWINAKKEVTTGNYRPMSTVPFKLTVENDKRATGNYVTSAVYDLLPVSFDYYSNPLVADENEALQQSFDIVPLGDTPALTEPSVHIIDNFKDGRSLVVWSWATPVSLEPGQSFWIDYKGQVEAGTPMTDGSHTYTNDLYLTTDVAGTPFWYTGDQSQDVPDSPRAWQSRNSSIKDTIDPTPGVDEYFVHASIPVEVKKSSQVESTKWNRGDLAPIFRAAENPEYEGQPAIPDMPFDFADTPQYTEFPYYSVTYEGGTADYKLVIFNSGNTRLGKIDVIDILPFVGDTAVKVSSGPAEERHSEWQPNLAEVLESGAKTFAWTPQNAGVPKEVDYTLKTYYSKSTNQDNVVNFDNVTGGKTGWTAQASFNKDDLTNIRSLYFELSGISGSDNLAGLAPGDYIVLDWKMDAPVGAQTDSVAWNSFAIQATENGSSGSGEGSKMLPTAPNKVGFLVHPDNEHVPLGELGDFVWFDSDRDGTQNEEFSGDSGQGAGINGVTVNLYKAGEMTPFKSSKTGYDFNGRPGYYLFQGLEAGDYNVEFVVPDKYTTTDSNKKGTDPNHAIAEDSNFVAPVSGASGYKTYKTDEITLGTAEKNRTIDLGLIETSPPDDNDYPSADMDKTITNVEPGTAGVASQDYVVKGNKVHYKIDLTNTSSVTMHNIKVSDALDRGQSGFQFDKLTYDGDPIAINGNTHSRPDIITRIDNPGTGSGPYVVIKDLAAGKSLSLEGTYTITADDIDGTDLDNTATVHYNESPDPITDDAKIPTAGLKIDKTANVLSVTEEGTQIEYTVTIMNTGSSVLHNVVINDSLVSGIPAIPVLQPGESKQIKYTYTVTNSDMGQPKVTNTASAKPDETPKVEVTLDVPVTTDPRGTIGDYVWLDGNEDGAQNDSESGLNGVIVKLYKDIAGPAIAETVTHENAGKDGYYLFTGLPEDTYYVQFIYEGQYGMTSPEVAVPAEDSNSTDVSGFTDEIVIGPSKWDDPTIDLGLVPRGEIGNYVWDDRNRDGIQNEDELQGINGIEVRLYKDSPAGAPAAVTTTANDSTGKPGYYLFDNLLQGNYFVQFIVPTDYVKTAAGQGAEPELDSNATDINGITTVIEIGEIPGWVDHSIDLGVIAMKGAIGDYVWLDKNQDGIQNDDESGVNGVTVKLYDDRNGTEIATAVTKDNGNQPGYYLFSSLKEGKYYVKFFYSGQYETTKPGVESPEADSNSTDGNGFTDEIVIGPSNWVDPTIDLGLVPRGVIGNYVWLDRNRNGIQDENELQGINGIEVQLFKDDVTGTPVATTTTAADPTGRPGYYLFDGLLPGDYFVKFIVPADYTRTVQEQGADVKEDSNATDENGFTAKIQIGETPGWEDLSIDLGLVAKGVIGNYVWLDSSRNGMQDEADDDGINNVKVKLYNKDMQLLAETLTADDAAGKPGYYQFDNLVGGQYFVYFEAPEGYEMTTPEAAGIAADKDSNKLTDGTTAVITTGEDAPQGWEDLTIDLGLMYPYYPYFPPVNPEDPTTPDDPEDPANPGTPPVDPGAPGEPGTPVNPGTPSNPGEPTDPGAEPGSDTQVPQQETTVQDKPIQGTVKVPEGGNVAIGTQPEHGTLTVDPDGKWMYTPEPGYTGEDHFSIIVTDKDGKEDEVLFDVNVDEIPLGGIEPGNDDPGSSTPGKTLPKTGESSSLPLQLAGLCLVILGIVLLRLRRKHIQK